MITLKTYTGQNINPADDAILFDRIIGASGKIKGCEITHLGANQLRIGTGRLIIKGRTVTVTEETIYANMAASGTVSGRLLIHMDLSNTEEPISFMTQAAASLPDLVQNEDCNLENGVYEIALATYQVSESAISGLSVVTPELPYSEKSIKDMLEDVNTNLDGKAPTSHTHDTRYYTKTQVDATAFPTGSMETTIFFGTYGNNVGSQSIPLQNADKYNITINGIVKFGDPATVVDAKGWTINKRKNSFSLEKNDAFWADFLGNQQSGKLFVVSFSAFLP